MKLKKIRNNSLSSTTLLLVILSMGLVFSCKQKKQAPKYYDLTENYYSKDLPYFNKVNIDSNVKTYYVQQAGICQAKVVCGTIYYDYLILEVKDSILHIGMKKLPADLKREKKDMIIYFSTPYLEKINITENADFIFQNYYKSDKKLLVFATKDSEVKAKLSVDLKDVDLKTAKDAEIDFDDLLVSGFITAESSHGSEIELSGRGNNASFSAHDNGEVDADVFMANNVTASAASFSKITCNSNGVLTASSTDNSSITYGGRTRKVINKLKKHAKKY